MLQVSYGFDAAGRLSVVSNGSVAAVYAYGLDGVTVTGLTQRVGTREVLSVARTFDGLGRLTSLATCNLTPVTFQFRVTIHT